jgi:hypothetical protein
MKLKLVFLLSFILCGALAAAAQVKDDTSPAQPTEIFTNKEKTFSIEMPREPFDIRTTPATETGGSEIRYKWLLREGIFFVVVTNFKEKAFDSQKDFDAYIKDLLSELSDAPTWRTTSGKPLTLGNYYGIEIMRQGPGGKTIATRVLAKGHVMYTLTAAVDETIEDALPLMMGTLDSFKISAK